MYRGTAPKGAKTGTGKLIWPTSGMLTQALQTAAPGARPRPRHRHADQGRRQRLRRRSRLEQRRLRQLHRHRPRQRAADAVRTPEPHLRQAGRRGHPRRGDREHGQHRQLDRAAPALRGDQARRARQPAQLSSLKGPGWRKSPACVCSSKAKAGSMAIRLSRVSRIRAANPGRWRSPTSSSARSDYGATRFTTTWLSAYAPLVSNTCRRRV